jgi:hypothetical protein
MRFSPLLTTLLLIGTLIGSSCQKESVSLNLPYRIDVPVLLATRISSYELTEIHFTIDLAVFKGDNEINQVHEYTGLPDSSFTFDDFEYQGPVATTWVRHTIEKAEYIDTVGKNTFSTMFLIDQSSAPENFDSTDYYNQRFQAFNAFYRTLEGQGKVVFSYYNKTNTGHDVLKVINNDFSDRWDPVTTKALLDLTHKQEGSSGLYDALQQALNFMSKSNVENKSITLFVRNKDDGSSILNMESIIALANSLNIKINVIWLIHETANVDLAALRQLSEKTGGFSVYMSSIYQSSTVFLELSKILKMEMSFYRVNVKITVGAPNYFSSKYSTGMYLYYYTSQFYKWSYVPIYLEKP